MADEEGEKREAQCPYCKRTIRYTRAGQWKRFVAHNARNGRRCYYSFGIVQLEPDPPGGEAARQIGEV